ncbi:hypothetical protein [Nocardia abscessus]|uniref:hypothetical protein n=1 Tax=Nocardia abscessus TaxID=120957 RepID=UPI002453DE28|nr:hypothetical protein [Nocardia abscessus]
MSAAFASRNLDGRLSFELQYEPSRKAVDKAGLITGTDLLIDGGVGAPSAPRPRSADATAAGPDRTDDR